MVSKFKIKHHRWTLLAKFGTVWFFISQKLKLLLSVYTGQKIKTVKGADGTTKIVYEKWKTPFYISNRDYFKYTMLIN